MTSLLRKQLDQTTDHIATIASEQLPPDVNASMVVTIIGVRQKDGGLGVMTNSNVWVDPAITSENRNDVAAGLCEQAAEIFRGRIRENRY